MNNNFNRFINRQDTNSIKWDSLDKAFGIDGILPMWVADMDFQCPQPILDSIERRNKHGIFGYCNRPDSLHESIINWMQDRHGWMIKKEWIVYSPGVVVSLNLATMTFTQPGDSIIIQSPIYPPFFSSVENHERELAVNPLIMMDNYYSIDFEDLEAKMAKGSRMMILCNPHNPVGRVWKKEDLEKIASLCEKYEVLMVSDDIHSDLIFPGHNYLPIASLSKYMEENSITCIAPSKTFNIPGLTMSAAIIPNPRIRQKFKKTINSIGIGMSNIFGIEAMESAYRYGAPWLNDLIPYLEENLNCLSEYFESHIPEIKVVKPEGTYLVWLNCRALKMKSKELHRFMAVQGKIGLNNGRDFGPDGEGFLRINIASPRSILEEGLQRIDKAMQIWRKENN